MCKKTRHGYQLNSGRLVTYDTVDFSILTPDEFKELSEEKASLIEVIKIKSDISKILVGIDELKEIHHRTKLEINAHSQNCPIRKDVVNSMIDAKIGLHENEHTDESETEAYKEKLKESVRKIYWEDLKGKVISGSALFKAVMVFVVALLSLGIISGFISNVEDFIKLVK